MASADNLNFDVLELIFSHLDGNDLSSVSLVSRSFLAGVIPKLYRRLFFGLHQSKRDSIMTPFATVRAHPQLATHVHQIDITVFPGVRPALRPNEIQDCAFVLGICNNLKSFMCSPSPIQPFLPSLRNLSQLESLRINAHLAAEQTEMLVQLSGVNNLTLDFASWPVVDALPRWAAERLAPTLTTLVIFMTHDLNENVLSLTLSHLPQLQGLHVISCPKVDHVSVFNAISHTPVLETLSFTTWESPRSLEGISPRLLPSLRNITIDTHCTMTPASIPSLWTSIFETIKSWATSLTYLTLKMSDRLVLGDGFIEDVLKAHGKTLEVLRLINCSVSLDCLSAVCKTCSKLRILGITIPPRKDLAFFMTSLVNAAVLHTLIDVPPDNHHSHAGPQQALTKANIKSLMNVVPNLRTVKSGNKLWTGEETARGLRVVLERKKIENSVHWFMQPR